MDFSRLHTYTPPHCTPDNTGYTYSLSSSYSTAALEFEKEHKINPVYDSPRMSRRSLRLQTSAGFYGDGSFAELTQNHNNSSSKRTSTSSVSRSVRSRRQQQESSMYESHSVSQTPQNDQTNLSIISTASDASLISSLLDESALRQSSTTHACSARRRRRTDHSSLLENGDASKTQTHAKMANGYICKDCCFHADQKTDEETAYSLAYSSSLSSAAHQNMNSVDKTGENIGLYHIDIFMVLVSMSITNRLKIHDRYCGSVNVGDLVNADRRLNLNGSLCDDCKGKQRVEIHMERKRTSYTRNVFAALWALVTYTGSGLLRVCSGFGSVAAFVAHKMKSVLWLAVLSPGKAASGLFWWLGTGWYQLVTLMSFINVFILTRCLPKLLKLLLFLLPFLLLFGLWYLGPASILTCLPAVNFTEWKTLVPSFASLPALPSLPSFPSFPSLPALPASTSKPLEEEHHVPPEVTSQIASDSFNSKRLVLLEQRVVALWDNIQQGELKAQQQHQETVGLVQALHEQINTETDRDHLRLWVSQLFEPKFTEIKGEMDRDASSRLQTEEQHVQHQTNLEARLAELELLLQNLNTRTTEIHLKNESPAPAPVSVGVSQEKHDALLLEVQRLEAELGRIRGDLQGVLGCQGKCDRLDTIHETVSEQVREQLYALLYGHNRGEVEIPEPLLPWLASQYMRSSDLTATLTMLERNILSKVSLQLQEIKPQQSTEETVTQAIVQTTGTAGISEEQVQLIVQRTLKLYSEDRTGQVDFALESGGGSILSTRCSETYETKTALMSLFGLPLWYFSQSPRVVIQPDMYPGNCWAFKGSHGYLVIRLSMKVLPTSFCLEHIPKSLSPSGNISSAPRRFTVFGLEDEYQEEGKLLGDYTYQDDGDSLQIFPVMENSDKAFQIIEMRVLSNWGHPEYTCLYRFRVHGRPHAQ
ncbi:SUN domain-containing protein 1 [Triplophysa tibetana]|uniref:SUN domain-containing protein 1 n=1 Tax=Triplophysa tibetana TaxID=1572043 RepID=A0A5A9N9Y0_9TELE|nr:SUN domain-containing protein 1 [Triplophysa tibetana]